MSELDRDRQSLRRYKALPDRDAPAQERWTDPDTGLVVCHPYERSPYSGAGNCWCGRSKNHRLHIPMEYAEAHHRGDER